MSKVPLNFAEKNHSLAPSFKLEVSILSNEQVKIKFGVKLKADGIESEDLSSDDSFCVISELIGIFNVSPALPKNKRIIELPVIANMVATIFPYTRERVTTLLGSSSIQYFLDSFNAVNFIKEFENKILFQDQRKKTSATRELTE